MKHLKLLLLLSIVTVFFSVVWADISPGDMPVDNPVGDVQSPTQNYTNNDQVPQTPRDILANGVAEFLATLITVLLGLIAYYLREKFNINIKQQMVIAHIAEKTIQAKTFALSNQGKKDWVINAIKQDKNISKWAVKIFGALGPAVDFVYQTVIKKGIKNVIR